MTESEQKVVVVSAGIVDAVGIADERIGQVHIF